MDETLRLLLNRAHAENSAGAWRAYALSLQRVFIGTPEILNPEEQIRSLINGVSQNLKQIKQLFETVLHNGHPYDVLIVENVKENDHFYITGFIILTGEASDFDWETAQMTCEDLMLEIISRTYQVDSDSIQRDHLLDFSREVKDNSGNLLCFFDAVYYTE